MDLHRHKLAAKANADAKDTDSFPSLNYYEERIQHVFSHVQPGEDVSASLLVLAYELLEAARRADPVYGLTPVGLIGQRIQPPPIEGEA